MVDMQGRLVNINTEMYHLFISIHFLSFLVSSSQSLFHIIIQIVGRVLRSMQSQHGIARIEDHPEHLLEALREALALVGTAKCYDPLLMCQS